MQLKNFLIGLILILFVVMAAIVGYLLVVGGPEAARDTSPTTFSVLESGRGGDFAYSVYSYRGDANITAISYPSEPKRNVVIINDSQAVDAEKLPQLVEHIRKLEAYGFNVSVTEEPKIGDAIYIVPTGGIPSYALFNLQQNSSKGTIIYIGGKDLILSSGMKQLSWYNALSPAQRGRVIQYNGTLNEFLENGSVSLEDEILYQSWMALNNTTYTIRGAGIKTAAVPLNHSGYMRLVYVFDDVRGIYDSPYLKGTEQKLVPSPQSIYPWEKSTLQFSLNTTNGTAFLSIKRDGKLVTHEQLRRVTDENVFIKKLEFADPGQYVISVDDNAGTIATGVLSVRDIQIVPIEQRGVSYVFSVTVDGKPLDNAESLVSLGNSTQRKYYITDGTVTVNAKLNQGKNLFNFEIAGSTIPVVVDNRQTPILSLYINYGIPGLAIIIVVYFGARMTKRPIYSLRFGDSANYIRQEITLPVDRAIESFQGIREDMKIGKAPITPQEFTVSLKRYLTNGADVTEGNVEEILKKLAKANLLETHRDYYQLKGEGDVKKNTLRRMIREKLIESGTMFRESEGKFITKDFEIGFFGSRFGGKGVIVVDDKAEEKQLLAGLSESERARIRLMQANDMLSFVQIDRLSDIL
ncbi:MAG: hypothetical protein U0R44_07195 [Candidatus Micrarchaeia archaeon]